MLLPVSLLSIPLTVATVALLCTALNLPYYNDDQVDLAAADDGGDGGSDDDNRDGDRDDTSVVN